MCLLAIETTASSGSYAIMKDERIVFQDFIELKTTHSETIMKRIDSALHSLKIEKNDLKAVCISNGPGSFTGCRIGLATAKGICTGLQVPLLPFDTLQILASNVYGTEKNILAIIDARMNEAYVAVFSPKLGTLVQPHCRPYAEITNNLQDEYLCVGHVHLITESDRFQKAMLHQNMLVASAMFSLMRHNATDLSYDMEIINSLEPYYIRSYRTQAGIKD